MSHSLAFPKFDRKMPLLSSAHRRTYQRLMMQILRVGKHLIWS